MAKKKKRTVKGSPKATKPTKVEAKKAVGKSKPTASKPIPKKARKLTPAQKKYHAVQKAVSMYYERFGVKPGRAGYQQAIKDVWKVSKGLTKKEATYLRTIDPVLTKRVKKAKAKIPVKYTVKQFPGLDYVRYYELIDKLQQFIPNEKDIRVRIDMTGVGLGVETGTKSRSIEVFRREYLQRFRELDAMFPDLKIYYEPFTLADVIIEGDKYIFAMEFETIPSIVEAGEEMKAGIMPEPEPEPEPEPDIEKREADALEMAVELRKIEKEEKLEIAKITTASIERQFEKGKLTYEQYVDALKRLQ